MSYDQQVMAFAATRLPALIGAGLVLAAAAPRWRTDRPAAALLAAGGALLAAHVVARFPVNRGVRAWGVWTDPLWDYLWLAAGTTPPGGLWSGVLFGPRALLTAAAAGGLAAVFLLRDPAGRGAA